jgi:hypothetical protein
VSYKLYTQSFNPPEQWTHFGTGLLLPHPFSPPWSLLLLEWSV